MSTCQIIIRGAIDETWEIYFGDVILSVTVDQDEISVTKLTGEIPDIAAFMGLLARVSDLGLSVLSAQYDTSSLAVDSG